MKAIDEFRKLKKAHDEKGEALRVKIQTVGGKDARYEVVEVDEDFFVAKDGTFVLLSAIASFSDVSGEPIR
jgi:hypothetical protein